MSVHFQIDAADTLRALRRLEDGPGIDTILGLHGVTLAQFHATQAAVHVQTGSLRTSGHMTGNWNHGTDAYTGEISYGGAAPGAPHDPVVYAKYEQRRAGTGHLYGGKYQQATRQIHRHGHYAVWDGLSHTHHTSHDFMAPIPLFEQRYTAEILNFMAERG